MRARYDPGTGQFLSQDPLVLLTQQPYAYVSDNPLNATDSSGLARGIIEGGGDGLSVSEPAINAAPDNASGFGESVTSDTNAGDTSGDVCTVNAKGQPYPTVPDPRTGEPIPAPPSGLTKAPIEERVVWTTTARSNFLTWWEDQGYEVPQGESVQVHHILPRVYGGTNAYDNLIPLLTSQHAEFTGWWASYGP